MLGVDRSCHRVGLGDLHHDLASVRGRNGARRPARAAALARRWLYLPLVSRQGRAHTPPPLDGFWFKEY